MFISKKAIKSSFYNPSTTLRINFKKIYEKIPSNNQIKEEYDRNQFPRNPFWQQAGEVSY